MNKLLYKDEFFEIYDGQIISFFGSSGSGKTGISTFLCSKMLETKNKVLFIDAEHKEADVEYHCRWYDNLKNLKVTYISHLKNLQYSLFDDFDVIFIDGFSFLISDIPVPINRSREAKKIMAEIKKIANSTNKTFIFTHHSYFEYKNPLYDKSSIYGGDGIRYYSDYVYFMKKVRKFFISIAETKKETQAMMSYKKGAFEYV